MGEISALTAAGVLAFEDGLKLVSKRALAMQAACEAEPSTMAAILGLENEVVEGICEKVEGIVVAANYNCPGQLVISGTVDAINDACELLKEAGARRALVLPVGGAFHSPLMEPARAELAKLLRPQHLTHQSVRYTKMLLPLQLQIQMKLKKSGSPINSSSAMDSNHATNDS